MEGEEKRKKLYFNQTNKIYILLNIFNQTNEKRINKQGMESWLSS